MAAIATLAPPPRTPSPPASIDAGRYRPTSFVSTSAASFQTAPLASTTDSRASSTQTLGQYPNGVKTELQADSNHMPAIVDVQSTPSTIRKANPPPPSPPPDVPPPDLPPKPFHTALFTSELSTEPAENGYSPALKPTPLPAPPVVRQRAGTSIDGGIRPPSTDMTASMSTARSTNSIHPRFAQDDAESQPKPAHLSYQDVQPNPPSAVPRPARRNTTGSSAGLGAKTGRPTVRTSALATREGDEELDSDILEQADQIRRERFSKRAKAKAAAETNKVEEQEKSVLVGNPIGEGHVNYVLMYNMLTGIRVAVSRCGAKMKRPLTDEDYTARHKYSFDVIGKELTPSVKYDFKFKDYAPWVFRELREDYFHLDPADYLLSLTEQYILTELGSPGKSGSFFYFSRDYRFIIKTIHHSEHKFLRRILKQYHHHVKTNPHTLLSRFYGLHRVKLPHGRKIHFVLMNNLFPPHRDIHETYDLKGSTVGRLYPEEKAANNPRAVMKDLNWIDRGKTLELGPEKRALLAEQLRRDTELLKQLNVMDYSLLVGIHNMQRGNRDNLRSNTLKVVSPEITPVRRKPSKKPHPPAGTVRRAIRTSDPRPLGSETANLPDEDHEDRKHFIFYQDEGGYQATDETNQPMDTIYYLGIIDICTPYTLFKRAEHFWKGLSADRHKISPVPAQEYGDRFLDFLNAVMRGGGGGERFKSE